tara:strand:- start:1492 stop:2232 length:741 start_codon:yes stop_codon:yes gene_type:complete
MKKLLLILVCLPIIGFGQDKFDEISFVDGNTINAEIIEIGTDKILFKYEKETLINRVDISKIVSIHFSSGRKQIFKPQIKHTDFKRMIEGMELYKGVTSETKDWLINKGFTLESGRHGPFTTSSGTYYGPETALGEKGNFDRFINEHFRIYFNIYDKDGRKEIRIDLKKDSHYLYEKIRSELSKKHSVKSFKHGNWYGRQAEEIMMRDDSYAVVFIRGIRSVSGFKCGTIYIANFSHKENYPYVNY